MVSYVLPLAMVEVREYLDWVDAVRLPLGLTA